MANPGDNLVEHYSTIDDVSSDFRNANLISLVTSLVSGETVVDIGSGSGFLAGMLQRSGKKVTGIEPEPGLCDLSRRLNPDVAVIAGKAEEIDALVTEPVDTVVMADVLEHIEHDGEQVQKIHGVLRENGEFVLVVPAHPFLFGERDRQMGHYRRYTKATLTRVLTAGGFRLERVRYWNALGVLPYLIAEKVLRRPLRAEFRDGKKKGFFSRAVRRMLHLWFRHIENRCNFGFGLSIIAVARKV